MVARLEEVLTDTVLRERLATEGLKTADRYRVSRMAPVFAAALENGLQSSE